MRQVQFKPVYVKSPKFVPWGYDPDPLDKHLYHPNEKCSALLNKVCKYLYAGATYKSAAKWLSHHAERPISEPGMLKLYQRWRKAIGAELEKGRQTSIKEKKKLAEERLGQAIAAIGLSPDPEVSDKDV